MSPTTFLVTTVYIENIADTALKAECMCRGNGSVENKATSTADGIISWQLLA
jgi:hypothetical protein